MPAAPDGGEHDRSHAQGKHSTHVPHLLVGASCCTHDVPIAPRLNGPVLHHGRDQVNYVSAKMCPYPLPAPGYNHPARLGDWCGWASSSGSSSHRWPCSASDRRSARPLPTNQASRPPIKSPRPAAWSSSASPPRQHAYRVPLSGLAAQLSAALHGFLRTPASSPIGPPPVSARPSAPCPVGTETGAWLYGDRRCVHEPSPDRAPDPDRHHPHRLRPRSVNPTGVGRLSPVPRGGLFKWRSAGHGSRLGDRKCRAPASDRNRRPGLVALLHRHPAERLGSACRDRSP